MLIRYDKIVRENIQKAYPPKSVLNLNAVYLSGGAQQLKWENESDAQPIVAPHG